MTSILEIIMPLLAGLGLGLFFFGGLLWTVRRIPGNTRPNTLVWTSFLVRQIVTFAVLILVCRDEWIRWVFAMVGFLIVRTLLIHRDKHLLKTTKTPFSPSRETRS
ncbi:ATP synthase subunit I [Desulfoplanes sp. PS50]